jgi:photoactive yellow protein
MPPNSASAAPARASVDFSPEEVLKHVDSLSVKELDQLPVGMIQLDLQGKILQFNQTEAQLARLQRTRQLGRNFFDEVAPCTKVREFYGHFVDGVARRQLYETFGFVFKFDHGWRNVAITLMYSNKTDTVWVLVSQKSLTPPPSKS